MHSTEESLFSSCPGRGRGKADLEKEKGFIVFQATPPPTLLDAQLHGGRVLCVPVFSPAPVPSCILLSQVAHHHGVSPIFLVAAGYSYSPFVGLVHKPIPIHKQGAASFLPPAQVLLLVVPFGIIVALHGQRASDCAAEKFWSLRKGGGCRMERTPLAFHAPHSGLRGTRATRAAPSAPSYLWSPAEPPSAGCPDR